jgi:p-methyltransferase
MAKTIGIIAPILSNEIANIDFILRLSQDERELTIQNLSEMIKKNYDYNKLRKIVNYSNSTVPAAGYYLTSLLRENGYNTIMANIISKKTINEIAKKDPFAICISTTMILKNSTLKWMIGEIRKELPHCYIIVGGVFVLKSIFWKNLLEKENGVSNSLMFNDSLTIFPCNKSKMCADVFIISNHGKKELLNVLKELDKGRKANLHAIPNLAIPDSNGNFQFTKFCEESVDFNTDFTKWDLIDELPVRIPIRTLIGCSYRCGYCDFCKLYPKLVLRTPESIFKELSIIKNISREKESYHILHITDDNVFFNEKRLKEICNTFIKAGVKAWASFMRASTIKPSNISLIKESGLVYSYLGIESGDQGQLDRMFKNQSIQDIKAGLELLDSAGISFLMTFLVGYPGETKKTIFNTANFINDLQIGSGYPNYQLYPMYLSPLSKISMPELRKKWKIKGCLNNWSHKTMTSQEATINCYELFKKIDYIPYHYNSENNLFLKKYDDKSRKLLFELRKSLTVKLIEKNSTDDIKNLLIDISKLLGHGHVTPPDTIANDISISNFLTEK